MGVGGLGVMIPVEFAGFGFGIGEMRISDEVGDVLEDKRIN